MTTNKDKGESTSDSSGQKNSKTSREEIREKFIRVGVTYFKRIMRTDPRGFSYEVLEKWSKETITDDYATRDNTKPFREVPRYDTFCNIPDNLSTYRLVNNDCYNIYQKPTHQPKEGSFRKTMAFLRHVYGESLVFGLDYISILWRYPKQRLPIHCLVSREQKTGKSTFIEWLRMIFQSNCAVIQNQDIEGQFNSHYATKLIVAIEEANLREDRRKISEKIKFITTSTSTYVNFKGVDKKEVDYYGKLFINSNEEREFIYIESEDTRYFVRKIPRIKEENPNLLDELAEEIPAFLHFIAGRKIVHPSQSRLWFAPEAYETAAKKAVMQSTKPKWQRHVDEFLSECFVSFDIEELEFTPKDIHEQIRKDCPHVDRIRLRDYLKEWGSRAYQGTKKYTCYNLEKFQEVGDELDLGHYKPLRTGRPYKFKRADWQKEELEKVPGTEAKKLPEDDLPI